MGLLAVAAVFVLIQGCGGDSSSTTATEGGATAQPNHAPVVSEAEVERYKEGTTQHTALAWWRTVQTNEPELARTLYAEPPTLPNLAGQFNFVAGQLAGTAKIVSVKRKGKNAVVTVAWDKPGAVPRRVMIGMERVYGEWKIATVSFLDRLVEQKQNAETGGAGSAG